MKPQENARREQAMADLRAELHLSTSHAMASTARALAFLDEEEEDDYRRSRGDSDRPSDSEEIGPISTTYMAGSAQ